MKKTTIVFMALLLLLAGAGAAGGAWVQAAAGSANASATTLVEATNLKSGKAKSGGNWEVTLCWIPSVSSFADGYEILRSTTSGSGYAVIATVSGGSSSSYTDTTVSANQDYYYVTRATKNLWRSPNSNETSENTKGGATTC